VYMISLSGLFQYMVRQSALVETYMTSVERMLYYGTKILTEEEYQKDGLDAFEQDPLTAPFDCGKEAAALAADPLWPASGTLTCKGLKCKYREDLPIVLDGVDFEVESGSKLGIVGRTGSGKSSLISAIFRLNDICGGKLELAGGNVLAAPLARLRSELTLIPQEPHFFAGTLRYNLDPFDRYSDAEIWAAIAAVELTGTFGRLSAPVEERGSNLSAGQKQLLSLARAMLRSTKVVILDEATASVDYATDRLVQRTLRESDCFKTATIISIAHRMQTVKDCDYILVLENGNVVEFGRRTDLTAKQDSVFAGMLQQSLAEDDDEEVVDSGGGGDNGIDARVVSGQIQHHVKAMVTSV